MAKAGWSLVFVDWRPVKRMFLAFSLFLVFAVTLICYFIYRYVSRKKLQGSPKEFSSFSQSGNKFHGQPSDRSWINKNKDTMNRNEALLKEEQHQGLDHLFGAWLKAPLSSDRLSQPIVGYEKLDQWTNDAILDDCFRKVWAFGNADEWIFDITRF